MNSDRGAAMPGRTRVCPHCKSVILESADVCPSCNHHLRFGPKSERRTLERFSAFRIEGAFQHRGGVSSEYTVVIAVRNAAGQEIKRHIVDVGAIDPGDRRSFNLSVDITAPRK